MLLFIIGNLLLQLNLGMPAKASGWETDYARAMAKAESEDKVVFMLFTGSDWCMACKRLDKKVLNSDPFKTFADDNFVLLEIDFPRDDRELSLKQKQQNELLAKRYNREGAVPKIVLLKNGSEVASTLYKGESITAFIKSLNRLIGPN